MLDQGRPLQFPFRAKLTQKIQAIEDKTKLEKLEGRICGYDPMNMDRLGDDLICRHFVMIQGSDQQQFMKGPLVLKMKAGDPYNLWAYQASDSED